MLSRIQGFLLSVDGVKESIGTGGIIDRRTDASGLTKHRRGISQSLGDVEELDRRRDYDTSSPLCLSIYISERYVQRLFSVFLLFLALLPLIYPSRMRVGECWKLKGGTD